MIKRRLRGLLGMGMFSGALWAVIGAAIGTLVLLIDPASMDEGESVGMLVYYFGRAGFVAGLLSGSLLLVTERRRTVGTLGWGRLALWGAAGGLLLPWLAVGPRAMVPIFIVMGAGTLTGALALARRGERLSGARKYAADQLAGMEENWLAAGDGSHTEGRP